MSKDESSSESLANLGGGRGFGNHHQDVHARDERGQLRTAEGTQIEDGPIRVKQVGQYGLKVTRPGVVFQVEVERSSMSPMPLR